MIDRNFDMTMLHHAQEYGTELASRDNQRDQDMDEFERMSKLKWAEEAALKARMPHVYITKSPDPRVAVQGVVRLLCSSDPVFHVKSEADVVTNDLASKLEKMALATWLAAGRVRSDPVHYDVVRSATIFDEIVIGVNNTKDMIEHFTGEMKEVYEEIGRYAPVLYDVYDPRKGHPDWDMAGLKAYYREYEMYAYEIIDSWGEYGEAAIGEHKVGYSKYDKFLVSDMYLRKSRCVWFTGSDRVIWQGDLEYGFIPIVSTLVQGSRLHDKPEDQRESFLYTMKESGLWKRQNLSLTSLYTNIAQLGLQPVLMYEPGMDEEEMPEVNTDGPVAVIIRPKGSKLEPWITKGLIDESAYRGMELAERKGGESTIYRQVLGEPMSGQVAYSTYALLGASGRLPLVVIQRKCSWAIADAVRMGLRMLRLRGGNYTATGESVYAELAGKDIPKHIEIEARLEMKLPQDQLAMANTANLLRRDQMVSKRWLRENMLQVENSDEMDDEIMQEEAEAAAYMMYVKSKIMTPPPQPQMPPGGMPQGGMPMMPGGAGGMPMQPGGMPMMPEEGGVQGLPGGMATGGMQGPMEQPGVTMGGGGEM